MIEHVFLYRGLRCPNVYTLACKRCGGHEDFFYIGVRQLLEKIEQFERKHKDCLGGEVCFRGDAMESGEIEK